MVDHHHELANTSYPPISLNLPRDFSPELRITWPDHVFSNPHGLLSPKMGSSAQIGF